MITDRVTQTPPYTPDEKRVIDRWIRKQCPAPELDDLEDASLIANIVLSPIQDGEPQWLASHRDGHPSRQPDDREDLVRLRDNILNPILLFEINWKHSIPGLSWPEGYYATLLPGYNIYIVTASQDSEDAFGHFDVAIGHFPAEEDDEEISFHSAGIVQQWWQLRCRKQKLPPWTELYDTGLFDEDTAFRLRNEVWRGETACMAGHDRICA